VSVCPYIGYHITPLFDFLFNPLPVCSGGIIIHRHLMPVYGYGLDAGKGVQFPL
jgi:hypothetical protein